MWLFVLRVSVSFGVGLVVFPAFFTLHAHVSTPGPIAVRPSLHSKENTYVFISAEMNSDRWDLIVRTLNTMLITTSLR